MKNYSKESLNMNCHGEYTNFEFVLDVYILKDRSTAEWSAYVPTTPTTLPHNYAIFT